MLFTASCSPSRILYLKTIPSDGDNLLYKQKQLLYSVKESSLSNITWGPSLKDISLSGLKIVDHLIVNCMYLSSSVHQHTHRHCIVIQAHLYVGQCSRYKGLQRLLH